MQNIRNSYKAILRRYKKIDKGNVRLTQSSLLLERSINATTDTYRFPVLETDPGDNAGRAFIEEIRLNQNDEFISYEVGYYIVADKTPTPEYLEADIFGRFFFTYAPDELGGGAVGALEDAWLGNLQILVNKISRLERWDLKKHNCIPRTQFKSSDPGQVFATQPSIDYEKDGTYQMQPMLTLSGAKKNDVIVSLIHAIPSDVVMPWTTPVDDVVFHMKRLALVFRGMLAQNAAKFQ